MKDFLKKLAAMLKTNWYLKALALVFAMIVWFFVMAQTNPSRDKTLREVGVIYQNIQYLTDKSLTTAEDLSSILDGVQVTVRAKQGELSYIDASNVSAVVDFSQVNAAGEAEITISASTKYGTVAHISPATVTVAIDELVTKNVPVTVASTGTQTKGYYYSRPELSPAAISITGAKRNVDRVVRASATIDYTGIISDISRSMQVTLYDESGEEVPGSLFADTPACIVTATVLPEEELGIDAESSLTGVAAIADGYEVKQVSVLPEKVTAAANAGILQAVSAAYTEAIDVSGLSDTITVNVALRAIPGVIFSGDPRVKVTVEIGPIMEEKTAELSVEVRNAEARRRVELTEEKVSVKVKGTQLALRDFDPGALVAYVDASGRAVGEYDAQVIVEGLPAGVSAVCEPATVRMKVS